MPKRACFSSGYVLVAALGATCATPAPPEAANVSAASTAAVADQDIREYRLRSLEAQIGIMPGGPDRDYLSGMLAVRSGRFADAITALDRALPRLRDSNPARAASALEALATAYRAENQYGDAARAYAELSDRFAAHLDRFPADDAALARILRGIARQTISWRGPVRLKTTNNPIDSPVAELVVNGVRGPWLLDTGANQSVVTRTFAERLGVTALEGTATVGSGLTGRQSPVRAAVLPTLQVGGAVLTNVVLVIIDDENLRIGSGPDAYQIDAILGYPVLKALGIVTFTHDEFLAGDASEPGGQSVPMYMRGLTPAVECDIEGKPLLFTLDTGASGTDLSVRYYELFRARANTWKTAVIESAGTGGSTTYETYIQPRLVMKVGTRAATLSDVSVSLARVNASLDILFGNLGQDFFDSFESVTLNFATMEFSVRASTKPR